MSRRRKNAGEGYGFMFSGAYSEKKDAVAKEKTRKGSFIKGMPTKHGYRYVVMTPRENPIRRKKKKAPTPEEANAYLLHDHAREWANAGPEKRKKLAKKVAYMQRIAGRENPSELLVMGANPGHSKEQEIKIPIPGGEVTIRTNPEPNPLFSFHPALESGKQQRLRGRLPFNRRVAAMVRRARGTSSGSRPGEGGDLTALRADVASALVNQGYKRATAKRMAKSAHGSDFSSLFNDALRRNPLCGVMIGGYPCTRKPGHKGPHLPQGATMRTRTRLRHAWQPNPSAEALREKFTGAEVDRVQVMSEPHMRAGDYAKLGKLLSLHIKPAKGGQVLEVAGSGGTIVVADETARQIYFVGGDQNLSDGLSMFGARDRGDGLFVLGEARRIDYQQRKEHVTQPELDKWRHDFGENSGVRPTVLYDPRHKRILLEGGEYVVREEGIVN